MNPPSFWTAWGLIARREYVTRIRRRAFLVATFLGPVLLVGVVAGLVLLNQTTEKEVKVYVADLSGLLTVEGPNGSWVPWCPACYPERALLTYRFGRESLDQDALKAQGFTCTVALDDGILQSEKAQLLQLESPPLSAKRWMERDLSQALERLKVREQLDVNYEAYLALKTDVRLVALDMETQKRQSDEQGALGFLFSAFMFAFVMVYGMHVLRGVIEEKSNRIVEVVLSTVQPTQLLLGKLAGIGAVGLTQMAIWSVLSWVLFSGMGLWLEQSAWMDSWANAQGLAPGTVDFESVVASQAELAFLLDIHWGVMLGCGMVYFVLGYALYAAFFAMIGSMVEQEADAQYLLLPVMLPLIFSYALASMTIEAPESTLAVASSFIPFSAPISMMVRLPMGVPWWHVAASMALLVVTTAGLIVLAARVYRVTILMTGKRPTLREVMRWMFQANAS
jgi:ABC-2 type transport system permease protein